MSAAGDVGAEHGRAAAEAWWTSAPISVRLSVQAAIDEGPEYLRERFNLPEPDLVGLGGAFAAVCQQDEDEYAAAYGAAVDEAIVGRALSGVL